MKTEIEKLKNEMLAEFEKKASEILAIKTLSPFKKGKWYHRIWDDGDQDIIRCAGVDLDGHIKYSLFWRVRRSGRVEDLTRSHPVGRKTINPFDNRMTQQWKRIGPKEILKGFNP